jgi:ankyrin repeat protein
MLQQQVSGASVVAPVASCFKIANQCNNIYELGQALCVAALLDSGAMQQVQTPLNPTAVTPMLLAAAHGREDCVRLLAAHNPSGSESIIKTACMSGLLLLSTAVNACDANGVTPLMMASAHASLPAVDALLQAGARPSVVDVFGRRYSECSFWKLKFLVIFNMMGNANK